MRVQSIGQNYQQNCRKQNEPSFQATALFVSKCLDGDGVLKLRAAGKNLYELLNAEEFSHTLVQLDKDTFRPYSFLGVGTNEAGDSVMIPKLEQFAKDNDLIGNIQPGFNFDGESLFARAKELIAKIKNN